MSSRIAVLVIAAAALTALIVGGCSAGAPTSPSPSGRPLATTSPAAATSSSPSDDCPTAEPVAIAVDEPWIVFQSLTDQFEPERCDDGVDHDDTIFLVRADGSGVHRLVPDDWVGSEVRPTWSPDGSHVAFLRARLPRDRGELWVIDADGTNPELLYACLGPNVPDSDCNSIGDPDWSPDGSAVYFAHDSNPLPDGPPGTFEIWRHDLTSGESAAVLTREDGMTVEQPRVSPDGKAVAYVRFRNITGPDPDAALFVADLETGEERQLTDWGLMPADPDWSVADRIAFNTFDLRLFPDTTEAANLYSVASDGSDLRQLTDYGPNHTRAAQPRWTSDGSTIVYTLVTRSANDSFGERRLASIAADGGQGTTYPIEGTIVGTHPEPRPTAE